MTSVISKCIVCEEEFEHGIYPQKKCDVCSMKEPVKIYKHERDYRDYWH